MPHPLWKTTSSCPLPSLYLKGGEWWKDPTVNTQYVINLATGMGLIDQDKIFQKMDELRGLFSIDNKAHEIDDLITDYYINAVTEEIALTILRLNRKWIPGPEKDLTYENWCPRAKILHKLGLRNDQIIFTPTHILELEIRHIAGEVNSAIADINLKQRDAAQKFE